MSYPIKKYPRTPHLQGSRLQPGDEDLSQIDFSSIRGRHLVVEEKIDGANSALSFDEDGRLLLQSRGHYLRGGAREVHYDLFKLWGAAHERRFYEALGKRYILYGEWMYAKHKVYYDALPHYFMEFDIFDREAEVYLGTAERRALLAGLPVVSVPVLAEGTFSSPSEILSYLGPSRYIREGHLSRLVSFCEQNGIDPSPVLEGTDPSPLMEGLYLKVEQQGRVTDRLKYVRAGFAQKQQADEGSWLHRAIIQNGLSVPLESLFEE